MGQGLKNAALKHYASYLFLLEHNILLPNFRVFSFTCKKEFSSNLEEISP